VLLYVLARWRMSMSSSTLAWLLLLLQLLIVTGPKCWSAVENVTLSHTCIMLVQKIE